MEQKTMIQLMLDSAASDLPEIKDPYQHAFISLRLAELMHMTSLTASELEGKQPQAAPEMPHTAKAVPYKQEKEIRDMLSVPSRSETEAPQKDMLENTPKMHDLNPQAPIAEKMNAAAMAEQQEPDIDSEEWKNKHLTIAEMDDTWTPAMKNNKQLVASLARLINICKKGVSSGKVKPAWLDKKVQEATGNRFMTIRDQQVFQPKNILTIESYISRALVTEGITA